MQNNSANNPKTKSEYGKKKPSFLRRLFHFVIPANFHNVFGLAMRLLFRKEASGRMAMVYSIMSLLLTPLDLFLQIFEKRRYAQSITPKMPQIFICGAPRSGTTVTAQLLIRTLPVYYFNNLTSLFPRSPILANKLFGRLLRGSNKEVSLKNFYGRTNKLWYPNDALYFWDRWTGVPRDAVPVSISPENQKNINQFFGAFEQFAGKPILNKNNSLNTYAHLIADILPQSYFICLDRNPVYLAQSHYVARKFIHGSEDIPYGISPEESQNADSIESICRQVLFHQNCLQRQQALIGKERFIRLPYEDFCKRPAYWIGQIAEKVLGQKVNMDRLLKKIPPIKNANAVKIEPAVFDQIQDTLSELIRSEQPEAVLPVKE